MNKIGIVLLCFFLNTVNLFATEKEWKRVVINLGIPVYADKTKSESINYVGGVYEPFYIRKVGALWEVKRETYPLTHGYIDFNDKKRNENREPYHIDYIPEDADYIDILILLMKRNGVKTHVMSMKPSVKTINFFEKILRKNQKNSNLVIANTLVKKDLIFLSGIKMRLMDLCSIYETGLRYTSNRKDALKLLTYAKSAIDINNIVYASFPSLAEKKCLQCYSYAASAYEFLDNKVKTLEYQKLAERYQLVADTYIALGNERGAIKYLKKELTYRKKKQVPLTKADPLHKFNDFAGYTYYYTNLIEALIRHKEYDEALMYAKEFYTLYEDAKRLYTGDKRYLMIDTDEALYFQAKIYNKQGKENEALRIFNKLLDDYKSTHAAKDKYFKLYRSVADAYFENKAYRESIRFNLKALDANKDKEYLFKVSQIYNKIIDAALKLDTKESDMVIKKVSDAMYALVLKQSKLKRYEMRFVGLEMVGDIFQKLGKYDEAAFAYSIIKNNNWDNEGEGRAEQSPVLLKLASVKSKEGNYTQALTYIRQALDEQIKFYGDKHTETGMIYDKMIQLYLKTEEYSEAYRYAQLSFNIFLRNRDQIFTLFNRKEKEKYLKSNTDKINLLLNSSSYYLSTLDKTKKSAEVDDTLHATMNAWLNYKGSIFDSENVIASLYLDTKDKVLKESIENLVANKRRLAKLYQSLPKPKEREQWKKSIKDTEETIATIINKISSKTSSLNEEEGLKSISYKDIAKNLKENELYIDYAKAEEHYYVFSLDNKGHINFIQIDVNSTKKIDTLVKTFREDVRVILDDATITNERLKALTIASKDKLSKLYELTLSKPLSKEVKNKQNLIISPDGALRLLPFEAMFNKETNKYLIEQKEIRYIPSGKELVRLYKYGKNKVVAQENNTTVIFSNPNFNAKINNPDLIDQEDLAITSNTSRAGIIKSLFRMRFAPLPGTKAEADSIKSTLKNEKLTEYKEEAASESNLMKVKEPKILHIATHGFFINDNSIPNPMLKSGIALSGANKSVIKGKSDGVVTALKLSGLDLRGTDLVVLSACQTGVVDINSTDSVSGLSKAFIQAGAKDIVMSLWSVNDEATKDLMSSFYQEMQKDLNYAKALKNAKLKMIYKGMHPFYWAPFIVNGR